MKDIAPSLTFYVSKRHMEEAVQHDSTKCAIKYALQEAYPDVTYADADIQRIVFTDPNLGVRYQYFTPPRARLFIMQWDEGVKNIQPFRVRLTNGIAFLAGWRAQRSPQADRRGVVYKHTGRRRIVPAKRREFGMRVLREIPVAERIRRK